MKFIAILACAPLVAVTACADDDSTSTESSQVTGTAAYRDATTDSAGAAREPAKPTDSMTITLEMTGTGQFDVTKLDPMCALDAGKLHATFASTVTANEGGAFVSTLGTATIATPSGCPLPDATGLAILGATIRAEIVANTTSCKSYCDADARASAEAQCGATASSAECRSTAESSFAAQCTTTCTTQAHAIVAETSLAATLFGNLDFATLSSGGFADVTADLTFDHLEDADGNSL